MLNDRNNNWKIGRSQAFFTFFNKKTLDFAICSFSNYYGKKLLYIKLKVIRVNTKKKIYSFN